MSSIVSGMVIGVPPCLLEADSSTSWGRQGLGEGALRRSGDNRNERITTNRAALGGVRLALGRCFVCTAARTSLLDHVGELVSKERIALARSQPVAPRRKVDVGTERERRGLGLERRVAAA